MKALARNNAILKLNVCMVQEMSSLSNGYQVFLCGCIDIPFGLFLISDYNKYSWKEKDLQKISTNAHNKIGILFTHYLTYFFLVIPTWGPCAEVD